LTLLAINCFGVVTGSSPGPLDSTTSTSPLGSASNWRGCFRPPAIFSIFSPAAAFGLCPDCQPVPVDTFMGGSKKSFGLGSGGLLPDCCEGSIVALLLQPASIAPRTSAEAPQ
jgi:hypothetical protein